jgi:hypothetical protein
VRCIVHVSREGFREVAEIMFLRASSPRLKAGVSGAEDSDEGVKKPCALANHHG